jgi:hypothetical protein
MLHRLGFDSGLLNGLLCFLVAFVFESAKRITFNRKGVVTIMNQLLVTKLNSRKNLANTVSDIFRDAVWTAGTEPAAVLSA